jgi:transposase
MATQPSPAAGRGQDADRGRDLKALEQRRLKASRLFAHGTSQARVACALGVSAQTASRWHARWQQGGARALRAPARQGRPPKLTPVQLRQLERALRRGARGHGLDEELWTLRRVAEVIWRRAGVGYHPGQVWRLLRGLGWSVQRPVRVAAERDGQAIARWVAQGTGRRSGNRPHGQRLAVLPGRVGSVADPAGPPHLGAAWGDPGAG